MAQTVATQRGTGSSASYNGSATLFTQSGGNATRVVFNQLAAYTSTSETVDTVYFTMNHVVSNGSSNVIGWYRYYGSNGLGSIGSLQLFPNPNGTSPTESIPFVINTSLYTYNIHGGMTSGPTGNYPGSSYSLFMAGPTNPNSPYISSYVPQNFWIGSGDSIVIRWYWAWTASGYYPGINYAYHFVTITES